MTNTETKPKNNIGIKAKQQLNSDPTLAGKDISKLITLVHHSVRFPDPALPNKPEFFNVPKNSKDIMSFGRIKLFNDHVLKDVYGNEFKSKSPVYKMRLIRSRLQAFIDQYTFQYMNGLGNALPDAALPEFRSIVKDLESQFATAQEEYINSWAELRETSLKYFSNHEELYPGVSSNEMQKAILAKLLNYTYKIEDKFLFQVAHFDIKPVEMETEEVDIAEKQLIVQARNEVAAKAGHDLATMVNEFKADVKNELRHSAMNAFTDLLKAIEEDKWNQKSINAVLKYIEKFEKLNFLDDKELEKFLNIQKQNLGMISAQDVKKDSSSLDSLHNVVTNAISELHKLDAAQKQAIQDGFGSMGKRAFDPF